MKKIANLIVAIVFTVAIALAVINTATTKFNADGKHSYASIVPILPTFPKKKKK